MDDRPDLEQQAFDFAMEHYGFVPAELTPERERLVRRSSAYQWHLLGLHVGEIGQRFRETVVRPLFDGLARRERG